MFWYIFTAVEVSWVVFISVWIILQRRPSTATLAWIFGLALLPIIGLIVYILFGPRRLERKRIRRTMARDAVRRWTDGQGRAAMDLPVPDDRRYRKISTVGVRSGEAPVGTTCAVRLFFDGDECFDALLAAIEAAEHHVHLEYYIFNPDKLGLRVSEALQRKAREGVEVRLLMDGFGSSRMKGRFTRPLREAGVKVSFFNSMRFARFKPRFANFRTHRKIVVVDGSTALTGGMNVMDEHLPSIYGDRAWRDCHLLMRGAAAFPLQLIFFEDWHYATGSVPHGDEYMPAPDLPPDGPLTQILGSGPDDEIFAIHRAFFTAIGQAKERILATTPYFVPDEPILAALTGAALRGVDVQLLVPEKTDSFLVGAAAKSYYADLTQAGVRVFEYQPSMIHAKTMVIDDDISIVGTANLDNRSFRLNFEVVAVLFDKAHAESLTHQFAKDLTKARELSSYLGTDLPMSRRLVEGVARLFSPIL